MSKFNIGDRVYYAYEHEVGTIVKFDTDGDPWVEWDSDHERKYNGGYYDTELNISESGFWSDFQERIKDRFQNTHL